MAGTNEQPLSQLPHGLALRFNEQLADPVASTLVREAEALLALGFNRSAAISAIAGLDQALTDRSRAHGIGGVIALDNKPLRVRLVNRAKTLADAGLLDAADAAKMEALAIGLRRAVKGYPADDALATLALELASRTQAAPADLLAAGRFAVAKLAAAQQKLDAAALALNAPGSSINPSRPASWMKVSAMTPEQLEDMTRTLGLTPCTSTPAELLDEAEKLAGAGFVRAAIGGPAACAFEIVMRDMLRGGGRDTPAKLTGKTPRLVARLLKDGILPLGICHEADAVCSICRSAQRGRQVREKHLVLVAAMTNRLLAIAADNGQLRAAA